MDDGISSLPTSRLLGSVPAVTKEDKKEVIFTIPEENLEIFPPGQQGAGSSQGQDEPSASRWKGVFSISSYTQFFDVDTDVVVDRMRNALYPLNANFFEKIDYNPDLYGPVWISTTLIFVLAALGNCATYLMDKRVDRSTTWNFNVNYINLAACTIYGYLILVPTALHFLLQYFGSSTSLTRLWCMWGYSLFIFMPAAILMVAPFEFSRWIIILLTASASSSFVALNLRSYIQGSDLLVVIVSALVLQFALGIFIKVYFFP